ncbi:MAG: histidine kinase [Rugosibacter sp.]|nr:histidine kinase [Rugosibacter sp.]
MPALSTSAETLSDTLQKVAANVAPDATQALQLLLISATDNSAAQLHRIFSTSGTSVVLHPVASLSHLHDALTQKPWDAVIYMPDQVPLPLADVLNRIEQFALDLPLILLTHPVTSSDTQQALRDGVRDVVDSHQLDRLVLAITREVREARHRADHRIALENLKESEARFRGLASNLPGMLFHLRQRTEDDYRFLYASEGCQKLFGVTPHDLLASASRLFDAFDAEEKKSLHRALQDSASNGTLLNWEGRTRGRTRHKWINLRSMPHRLDRDTVEWRGIATNITQSKESEAQLRKSRQQLAELSSHLEAIKEEERERISRDIHDELGSILVRLKIEVALLASKLPDTAENLRDKAYSIEGLLDQAMGTASRVARELRPGILKEFGLPAAIECQAEDFTQRFNIPCHVQSDEEISEPTLATSLALFRIAQEALTNIAKHANASQVFIRLHREHGNIVLEVSDNGRGISEADLQKPKSFGLRGIRERISSLAGSFVIVAAEQGGTHMTLRVPEHTDLEPPADEEAQRALF